LIPNTFHFVFGLKPQTEPFHLMHYLCLASCIAVNEPDAVHFHYQHEPYGELWDTIRPRLQLRRIEPNRFVAGYGYADPGIARFRYAHLADFARLEIVAEEGGVYADMDTLFLRPIPAEWRNCEFIVGRERTPPVAGAAGSLCNAWLASAPGASFGRRWLEGMREAFDGSWSNHSTLLPYELSQAHPETVEIKPEAAFYALDWTAEGVAGLFERNVALPESALSLHLWSHLWFDRHRRYFSNFDGRQLTVDYVGFADTTYANHARRFLPPGSRPSRSAYARQRLLAQAQATLRALEAGTRQLGRSLRG